MDSRASGPGPFVLGLTGGIACGKTTVGDRLLELGALERLDADRITHSLMNPGSEVTRHIEERLGPDVLAQDGSVDRKALGSIVFRDPSSLRALEEIVHPAVREEVRKALAARAGQHGVVVLDAVKLLQSPMLSLCGAVWVVTCSQETQMERLVSVRGFSPSSARQRLEAQPPFEHPAVSRVIHNDGPRQQLEEQVEAGWADLMNKIGPQTAQSAV